MGASLGFDCVVGDAEYVVTVHAPAGVVLVHELSPALHAAGDWLLRRSALDHHLVQLHATIAANEFAIAATARLLGGISVPLPEQEAAHDWANFR